MSESFNNHFECEVLAGCVADADYRKGVRRILRDTDPWSTDSHRELWTIISRLGSEDRLTGSIVAHRIEELSDAGRDAVAEDLAATAKRILTTAPKASGYAAEKLRDWVKDYRIRAGIEESIKHLSDQNYSGVSDVLKKLTRSSDGKVQWEGGDWWAGFDERQDTRINEAEDPEMAPSVPTRLPTLDRILNGGHRTTKVGLVVGHTGRGKSATLLSFAFFSAAAGKLTVYVSTEMNKALVDTRFDARCFGYPTSDFATGRFTAADLEEFDDRRVKLAGKLEQKLHTYSIPPRVLTLPMLHEILDEVEDAAGERVVTLVIDSPDHMRASEKMRDYRLEQAAVYWDIKQIAEERALATWASTQGTKEYLGKLITAEGTSESYDKARIADVILTLNQTDAEAKDSIVRMFVAKNRSGERGDIIYLNTDFARMHIEEGMAPAPPGGTTGPGGKP